MAMGSDKNSNALITQCPNCHTRIELTHAASRSFESQLRCGACLKLFSPVEVPAQGSKNATNPSAEIRARALTKIFSADTHSSALEPLTHDPTPTLEIETLELSVAHTPTWQRTIKSVAGFVLTMLLLMSLAAQFLWANRIRYLQLPNFYPLYATACKFTGCQLPPYSDIAAIRGERLTVEAAGDGSNTLSVRFILVNNAPLPQAVPVLILSFETAANRNVALREFAPAEYLPENRRPERPLSSEERIAIRLDLIDPGPDAVNYTLAFRAL